MATLLSAIDGNINASTVFAVCDTTSALDSEAGNQVISTTPIDSTGFIPGAITIDGIALKIAAVAASPSGTFTVTLRNITDSLDVDSVTINVSDLTGIGSTAVTTGWTFFKFGSNRTLSVGKTYAVRVVCSTTGNQVTLFRNATTNNWSRQLRTTTKALPVANDYMIICGDLTAAATGANRTITMNMESGSDVLLGGIVIGRRGILIYGTAASKAYFLKISGLAMGAASGKRGIEVCAGGTFNIGTSGTPIPSTSTATLEFQPAAPVESGIEVRAGGTFTGYGAPKTTVITQLNADVAAASNNLTVLSTAGWIVADVLAIAGTRRVSTHSERKIIGTVSSGTQILLTVTLTNARDGSNNARGYSIRAHIGNLTRNVKIRATGSTNTTYINGDANASCVLSYCEMYNMGSNTAFKRGVEISGAITVDGCSFYDFSSGGSRCLGTYLMTGTTITNNVFAFSSSGLTCSGVGAGTVTGNLSIGMANQAYVIAQTQSNYSNNVATGCGSGFTYSDTTTTVGAPFDSNEMYCNGSALILSVTNNQFITNMKSWRNVTDGCRLWSTNPYTLTVTGAIIFGNANTNADISTSLGSQIILDNCLVYSEPGFTTTTGLFVNSGELIGTPLYIYSSEISGHTNDILISVRTFANIYCQNCIFTVLNTIANTNAGNMITSQKHGQVAGDHRTFKAEGTLASDSTIGTVLPTLRMTPVSTTIKLEAIGKYGSVFAIPVASGKSVNFSAVVRKSASGDGATYNGNQPRLVLKRNDAIGVTANTVLATASAAAGTWETLQGDTPAATDDGIFEAFVDCDGTVGWVNVGHFDKWIDGQPVILKSRVPSEVN